ncbi:MAG TPA: hypothetical protein VN253_19715 [Kofleriaceae bacterium]|nr:hypothetical protein [Kofleriaceae bacterium]
MTTPIEPVVPPVEPLLEPLIVVEPQVTAERSAIVSPLGWSAIFAGAAVAVGVWLVLHTLGIGIGLTAIDPEHASTLRGAGIGAGVWGVIVPIIALFLGGLVTGRVAPTINTANAAIHGAVVWAITAIAALMLFAMAVSAAVRGAAAAGTAVSQAASSMVSAAAGSVASGSISLPDLGISTNDLVAPINRHLEAEGKPPVTAGQLAAATQDAIRTAVRQGRIDREQVIRAITSNTELSRADAEELATRAERGFNELRAQASQLADQAKKTALEAAEATGKVLTVLSFVMIVGLGASILGSIISVRRERREHVVLPRAHTSVRP